MTKYVSDTSAAKSLSAYIILNRKGEHVATVKAYFGNGGSCLVNVHDSKAGFQYARARGYGYDKFTAALSGLTIDGHKLNDHCGESINPPKGKPCFPANYKPRKGFQLANYGQWERADSGQWERRDSYHWRELAVAQWRAETGALNGLHYPSAESEWEEVQRNARKLARDAESAGKLISGYSSCFRESGLKYLEAIGYRVIQAI